MPEIAGLDRGRWEEVRRLAERGLARRPASVRRQVVVLVRLLDWLPVLRHGRRFVSLDPRRRTRFLRGLERSRLLLLRRGVWGLRTLAFLGYYGRPEVHAEIGYRAHPDGWEARPAARTEGGVS